MEMDVKVTINKNLPAVTVFDLMPRIEDIKKLAMEMKHRVFVQGISGFNKPFPTMYGEKKAWFPKKAYDEKYAFLGNGKVPIERAGNFKSLASYIVQRKHGNEAYHFNTSGGLAASMTVAVSKAGRIRIFFAKSSVGYSKTLKNAGKKVPNNIKAASCIGASGIHILQPTEKEISEFALVVQYRALYAFNGAATVAKK